MKRDGRKEERECERKGERNCWNFIIAVEG
jgi:hypothetical protein